MVAFWAHDETAGSERVDCPLLFVIGEDDKIVNPAAEAAAAWLFPAARHALVAGGTHYLMYERAGLIADLLLEHATAPSRLHELRGDLTWTQLPATPGDADAAQL
jgi:pimeloyl-ACP methyl ester carboxylesterase